MSTWIKLRVHRSLEVAGSQALRTDGVSMSIEAGRAFQTENSLGKEWEVGQCREQRRRVSAETVKLAPSREDGGSGEGAQPRVPWWSGHMLPIPGATWAPCS